MAFETGGSKWQPRCYQHNAITSVLEAIARGERRILLTLATGTAAAVRQYVFGAALEPGMPFADARQVDEGAAAEAQEAPGRVA